MDKLLKIIVLGFLALVVLSVLGFFAFVGVVTPTRVTMGPAPTPTVLAGSAPANAATRDGVTVTASNLHQISGGAYSRPPAGQQYIVVTIELTNQGTHSARYNALDFQLEDATDLVRHDADLVATHLFPTALSSGSIVAGETLTGAIVFRVPATEHRFSLLWTPTVPIPISG
jgi:hypothetical protein